MTNIELITGCMFCGKTEELLRRIRREMIAGRKCQLFKPIIDDRYTKNAIHSHSQIMLKAQPVSSVERIGKELKIDTDVIAIDEIQFFDDLIIHFCLNLNNQGKKIILAGLNLDFRGEPFQFKNSDKHIGYLMPYSKVTTLRAICTRKNEKGEVCGKDADYTQRIIDGKPALYNSPTILVGSQEKYEARCKNHHFIDKKTLIID